MPPPVESMEGRWSPAEQAGIESALRCSAVGAPDTVRRKLETLLAETDADELMVNGAVYDHAACLRSFELVAELRDSLGSEPSGRRAGGMPRRAA